MTPLQNQGVHDWQDHGRCCARGFRTAGYNLPSPSGPLCRDKLVARVNTGTAGYTFVTLSQACLLRYWRSTRIRTGVTGRIVGKPYITGLCQGCP